MKIFSSTFWKPCQIFLLLLVSCSSTIAYSPSEKSAELKDRKPNFVYIMLDELGYYELSIMGHPHIQTPNIDHLARKGMRFTHGLAGSSLCAPTRCSLMTGKHSGHTSVRSNGGGTPLRADELTIATILKEAGYATGGFGKWGCGGRGSTGVPEEHGFDLFFGYYDQVHAHSYYPPYLIRNSEEVPLEGNNGGRSGKTYAHYEIYEEARSFITKNAENPFFCYMPFTPPHGLFDIPDTDPALESYRDKHWPREAKRYAAMVTMVDRQIGEIIQLLKDLEIAENTLVIFCGDNGGQDYFRNPEAPRGFHAPNVNPRTGVEFRGQKSTLYEGGLRVPVIAYWPGTIEPGQVSDHLWYFPDIMPTLAEFAKISTPSDSDGISIARELLGEPEKQRKHEYLYWELGQKRAVRSGNWKATRPGRGKSWELYDLSSDPSERNDLSKERPELLKSLKQFAQDAHIPVKKGTFSNRALHERDRQAKQGFKKKLD